METKKDLTKQPQWVQNEFKKLQIKIARLEKEQQNTSQFAIARLENRIKELLNYYTDIIHCQKIIYNLGIETPEINTDAIREKVKMIRYFINEIKEIQKPY